MERRRSACGRIAAPRETETELRKSGGKAFEEDDFFKIILYWNLGPYVVLEV